MAVQCRRLMHWPNCCLWKSAHDDHSIDCTCNSRQHVQRKYSRCFCLKIKSHKLLSHGLLDWLSVRSSAMIICFHFFSNASPLLILSSMKMDSFTNDLWESVFCRSISLILPGVVQVPGRAVGGESTHPKQRRSFVSLESNFDWLCFSSSPKLNAVWSFTFIGNQRLPLDRIRLLCTLHRTLFLCSRLLPVQVCSACWHVQLKHHSDKIVSLSSVFSGSGFRCRLPSSKKPFLLVCCTLSCLSPQCRFHTDAYACRPCTDVYGLLWPTCFCYLVLLFAVLRVLLMLCLSRPWCVHSFGTHPFFSKI